MPELTPEQVAKLAAYEKQLRGLIARSLAIQARDLRRIRARFDLFRQQALAAVPQRYALTQANILAVTSAVSRELERLSREIGGVIGEGIAKQEAIARSMAEAYIQRFLPGMAGIATARLPIAALDILTGFSAELIGLSSGGLSSRILAEVNRVVRLAAVGAGDTPFNAAAEISRALGIGSRWSFEAERIYRTEVLRAHSLVTESNIRQLNARIPTGKRWKWSGISREEHRQINDQTVPASGRFTVPVREGGFVEMLYPRDPGAPASAVANCGCFVVPWPLGPERRRPPVRRRAASPTRVRRVLAPKPRELTVRQRIALEEAQLANVNPLGGKGSSTQVSRQGISEGMYLERLERVRSEWERLLARYPGASEARLRRLLLSSRAGGEATGTVSERWDAIDAGFHEQAVPTISAIPARGVLPGADVVGAGPLGTKLVRIGWSQVRTATEVEDIFRHELGHVLDAAIDLQNDSEWIAILKAYPVRSALSIGGEGYAGGRASWWAQIFGSEYATRIYPWERRAGGLEAWAELFSRVTSPRYRSGDLPPEIERFVERVLRTDTLGGEP